MVSSSLVARHPGLHMGTLSIMNSANLIHSAKVTGLNSARFSELADFHAKGRRSIEEKLLTTSKQQQQQHQEKQRQRENVLNNLPVKIPIWN